MYTNKTGSNLNFNLYKGGKKHSRKFRKSRKGGSWFKSSPSEPQKKTSKKCEDICERETKKICPKMCNEIVIETADDNKGAPSTEVLKTLSHQLSSLNYENKKLREEISHLKKENSWLEGKMKHP